MVNILELWKKCFWLIVKVGNDLCIKWRKRLQFEPNLHGVRFQPGRSTTILVSWPRGVPTVIQKYGSSSRWEMLTSDLYGRRKKQFISLSRGQITLCGQNVVCLFGTPIMSWILAHLFHEQALSWNPEPELWIYDHGELQEWRTKVSPWKETSSSRLGHTK